MKIPPANRLITNPRTVLPPAPMLSPTSFPDWLPSSSMIGLPAYPGWVVPSMITGSSIEGRPESGWIVNGPAPGMAKSILSSPAKSFAAMIACRSDPGPPSSVLDTVNVESSVRSSNRSAIRRRARRRADRPGRAREMECFMGVVLRRDSGCIP